MLHKSSRISPNLWQEEKNRPSGGAHRDDHYNDRYSQTQQPQQPQQQQQLYGQQNTQSSPPQTIGADGADPYAAYGGYQNYVTLWYRSIAQQQQAPQDQGPPGEQRPPGSWCTALLLRSCMLCRLWTPVSWFFWLKDEDETLVNFPAGLLLWHDHWTAQNLAIVIIAWSRQLRYFYLTYGCYDPMLWLLCFLISTLDDRRYYCISAIRD